MDVVCGMFKRALAIATVIAIAPAFPANAQDRPASDAVRAGRELAVTTCSECHVVVPRRFMAPRTSGAPDFVDIANEPSMTAMGLVVFLHTPHASMPNLILSDRESNDVIAYIQSLRRENRR